MWRARTRTLSVGEGGNLRRFFGALDEPRTRRGARVLLSPLGGGDTVGTAPPAPLEQADLGEEKWKGGGKGGLK